MNIKALPSVGSAFFVAFVLWSRRFAVPLQKESSILTWVCLPQIAQIYTDAAIFRRALIKL